MDMIAQYMVFKIPFFNQTLRKYVVTQSMSNTLIWCRHSHCMIRCLHKASYNKGLSQIKICAIISIKIKYHITILFPCILDNNNNFAKPRHVSEIVSVSEDDTNLHFETSKTNTTSFIESRRRNKGKCK